MDVYIDRNKFKFKGCLRTSGEVVEKEKGVWMG